jgi:hypothetical protein
MCGDCCKGFGGTYVAEEEIRAISNYLNIDSVSFINKYCQITRTGQFYLRKRMDIVFFGIKNVPSTR